MNIYETLSMVAIFSVTALMGYLVIKFLLDTKNSINKMH